MTRITAVREAVSLGPFQAPKAPLPVNGRFISNSARNNEAQSFLSPVRREAPQRLFKRGKAMTGSAIAELTINSAIWALVLCMFLRLVKRAEKSIDKTDARVDTTNIQLAKHSEQLVEIKAELKGVKKEQSDQSQRLTTVETDLKEVRKEQTNQSQRLTTVETDLKALSKETASFRTETQQRFDKIDSRMDKIDSRIDTIDSKMDARFAKFNDKMDSGFAEMREIMLRLWVPSQSERPHSDKPDLQKDLRRDPPRRKKDIPSPDTEELLTENNSQLNQAESASRSDIATEHKINEPHPT